jgi:endonuclease/exonuclease/phosphatase family metal-dependent hydrolase
MTHVKYFRWGCCVLGLLLTLTLAGCDNDSGVDAEVTVVNLNILHGFACDPLVPADGDQCRVEDRIALLVQHLDAAGCPDIVTLQEHVTTEFVELAPGMRVGPLANTVTLLTEQLPTLAATCDFTYEIVFDPEGATVPPAALGRGIDEEMILSRYPALDAEVAPLYSPLFPVFFRHVLFARIDHPQGPVDVFTTHLAAAADFGDLPCGAQVLPPGVGSSPPCPAECDATQDTVRECQAKQMARFIEMRHDVPNPVLVTGDFNTEPFTKAYNEFADRGWLDSHLAATNAECDPVSGVNCTAGREDQALSDLEARALNQNQRIDFIFVVPATAGARCTGVIEPMSTGLFAAMPNPFVNECGPLPDAICWPSDHSGVQATLVCQ